MQAAHQPINQFIKIIYNYLVQAVYQPINLFIKIIYNYLAQAVHQLINVSTYKRINVSTYQPINLSLKLSLSKTLLHATYQLMNLSTDQPINLSICLSVAGCPAGPVGPEHQFHRGQPLAEAGGAGIRLQQRKHCK